MESWRRTGYCGKHLRGLIAATDQLPAPLSDLIDDFEAPPSLTLGTFDRFAFHDLTAASRASATAASRHENCKRATILDFPTTDCVSATSS
jgi:hypothetical protein